MRTSSDIISADFIQEHSMMVAQCSKIIALEATDDPEVINNCFLAGMLHDIGRLLLISHLAHSYLPLVESVRANDMHLNSEERNELNATHGDIGAYLIGLWGFNADILEAIAYHNNLSAYPRNSFSAAVAVHVADALYYENFPEKAIGQAPILDKEFIEKIGMSNRVEAWSKLCATVFESSN
jgi:HD-like signal output (HDOD) protein